MENLSFDQQNEPRNRVPAIAKAVRILDVLGEERSALGVSEIARRTGLGKSTVHGLILALADEGLVSSDNGTKSYRLGAHLVTLATRARDQRVVAAAAHALMAVAAQTGETALFGRLAGDRVIILSKCDSPRLLNLSARVGSSLPVMAGALGKAYLASVDDSAAEAFLREHPLQRHTGRSVTEPDRYMEMVHETRRAGYAIDRGEYLPGVVAVGSAVDVLGNLYFVWTVGLELEDDERAFQTAGEAVRRAASALIEELNEEVSA